MSRQWNLWEPNGNERWTWDAIQTHLLLDIRGELERLNALLACPNFTGIPATLRSIRRNTAKPRKPKRLPTRRVGRGVKRAKGGRA